MNETSIASLLKQVDDRKEELIELAKTLIRFKTPSPPARNTAAAQQFVSTYLTELGFSIDQWDVYEGDPNVVGVLSGTNSVEYNSLLINGHIDVASIEEGEQWDHDPFNPIVKGNVLYGRGAA